MAAGGTSPGSWSGWKSPILWSSTCSRCGPGVGCSLIKNTQHVSQPFLFDCVKCARRTLKVDGGGASGDLAGRSLDRVHGVVP